jgi:hypothetical protein
VRVFQGLLAVAIAAPAASADPAPATETGVYAGTFISNFFHQFYDDAKWTAETRPNISKVSPQLGARYAYWAWSLVGFEAEGSIAIAGVDGHDDTAKLYGLRVQALVQYPFGPVSPFAAAGAGILHTSSNTLGSDSDWPVHVGVGARYFITPALAVRFDARLIRGPSTQPPYTLGATYGEFALGVSWVPDTGDANVAE